MNRRNKLLAGIHAQKRALGMDEEAYRAMILNYTENVYDSAKELTEVELGVLLARMQGRRVQREADPGRISEAQITRVRALYMTHARVKTEDGFRAFVKRVCGVDNVRWVPAGRARALMGAINKLKRGEYEMS